MPVDRDLKCISYPASGDLSAGQFRIVAIDANGRVGLANGTVDKVVGILQNKPSALGQAAQVAIGGVSRCVAGASVAPGDFIVANAQGFALAGAGATSQVVGRAVSNEANGSALLFECQIGVMVL